LTFGGLAERSNTADYKSVNGGPITVLGSNSLPAPVKAATSARKSKRSAKAARTRKFSIRLLAVELNRRFDSDLPELPERMP
jgi:hypothetical protein